MKKSTKKILIIISVILGLIVAFVIAFFVSLTPVSKKYEEVSFEVKKGEGKKTIITNLEEAKLIKSKFAALLYVVLTGNKDLQAGDYVFAKNMSTQEIIQSLNTGDVVSQNKPYNNLTFIEGHTLKKNLELVSQKTNLDYDTLVKKAQDKEYLKELIDKYWFLTEDVLDDDLYYALEGYLFPETYSFYEETTPEQVINTFLKETEKELNTLKKPITKSNLSVHEILTIASIVEKEANTKEDRQKVAQVIFTRLNLNMSLGMDVTTYYGVQKDFKDESGKEVKLTLKDLADNNPYNTRVVTFKGLPAGPICNPSKESIEAVLNPADTNYVYFYAEKSGKIHFTASASEFEEFKRIYG